MKRIFAFLKFLLIASHRALKIDSDVVFASSTPLTICIPAVLTAKIRRIPLVFEVRDLWPEMPIVAGALKSPLAKWAARRLESFAYRNSTRVVVLSPGMAEGVGAAGYPRRQIRLIPNSCDLDRFASDASAGSRFRQQYPELGRARLILYAGTMGRLNDVAWLVRVAEAAKQSAPDLSFVVFGEGSEETRTLEYARELGVLDRNYFQFGRISKEQVVDAFLAADVVTSIFAPIPEMEKNSANKFFDGLAAGKPVAINYGGWQADLLQESGAGLVLDRDPEIAVEQLVDFLANPARVAEAGHAARVLAEERFSRDRLAKQLEAVLREATEQG